MADSFSMKTDAASRGALRAAAVLLGLGPDAAGAVFRQLSEPEVRRIAIGARELRRVGADVVPEALQDFIMAMEKVGGDAAAGDEVLRAMAAAALGDDVARRAFERPIAAPAADEALGPLGDADAEALAMVLAREQAQTVALVLSALSPEKAAQVMEFLPEAFRPLVVRRMATVESVAPEVLREVRNALTSELQAVVAEGMRKVDGKSAALEVLRRSPHAQQQEVLNSIEKDDPKLADELRNKLFTFEDLTRLVDRDVQSLLKDVNTQQLVLALKGCGPELKQKFLRNMSSRAAEALGEDLAAMGPVKLALVEAAQGAIVKQVLELADKGKITIVRPTDRML